MEERRGDVGRGEKKRGEREREREWSGYVRRAKRVCGSAERPRSTGEPLILHQPAAQREREREREKERERKRKRERNRGGGEGRAEQSAG